MSSLATISKELGLSKATVSRAFDPRFAELVKPATRKRIFDFCREHDYHPTLIGRSFSTGRTFKIGVIAAETTVRDFSLFSAALFNGISEAAMRRNYTPVLLNVPEMNHSCIDQIKSSVADGYIISSSFSRNEELCQLLVQKNIPAVIYNPYSMTAGELPVFCRDIRPCYRKLWRNLPEEDWNRTAFIGRGLISGKWKDLQAAAPQGVKIDQFLISEREENFLFHRDSARAFAEKMLDCLLKYKLLWCSSDLVALGICDILKAHGIVPGKDIYVVGFDNLESMLSNFLESGLTTIDPNWRLCGCMLVEMLLDSLESGRRLPERTPWFPQVVFRDTFPENNERGRKWKPVP